MLPTTLRSPPALDSFVPLAEYEAQTPEMFVAGKPVLHCRLQDATASVPQSQSALLAIFSTGQAAEDTHERLNGDQALEPLAKQQVDVFVGSESLTLFSPQAQTGVSIPYLSIPLHALKHVSTQTEHGGDDSVQAVWIQLDFSDGDVDDGNYSSAVELTIIPAVSAEEPGPGTAAKQLYEVICRCTDLHPDPVDMDEDDGEFDRLVVRHHAEKQELEASGIFSGSLNGALPPPMPGSAGWITADNVHEYFDADGNWIADASDADGAAAVAELGEGTGRTRAYAELETEEANDQVTDDEQENKRPRVGD